LRAGFRETRESFLRSHLFGDFLRDHHVSFFPISFFLLPARPMEKPVHISPTEAFLRLGRVHLIKTGEWQADKPY
jgi:hypothetical protein